MKLKKGLPTRKQQDFNLQKLSRVYGKINRRILKLTKGLDIKISKEKIM